ncbi:undecaprenyldiphospho-muramoylpentapeptide beta-N-acetylglucosaminyltransferase [Catenovulum sp. 2E275]|uniref:undecaprenyldiphospho-muramoylpentapeptide beta-N-acetylglucosaminyltransferase n=1 Tax=Catenovulum sp. 2E275 TaxID=2980497 RepID=UPI0021D09662|nr:undecaprenyldiphospho-muramoylpentapeptide beta-N-acetylglucosaminyltransferase [Catenovulum sp. 2E275]MCU4674213.1 undecaprenyldiphospho-muramoylpentapeptide beta-N-acetylglucosaminyltransferase [Catenovulum sp. 2E275]
MTKRILIMAGGTGGHIFPGLAVAQELSTKGWQVLWLGTADRMEADLVPKAGFDIEFINIKGVRNKSKLAKFKSPFMVLNAVMQARKVIKQFKPDVVVGFGGYVALPGGIAAWLAKVPLVIHEQNAAVGLTNRILSRFANKVLVAFSGFEHLGNKMVRVGNPLRKQIAPAVSPKVTAPVSILVVGGSLGAQALNQYVPKALAGFAQNDFCVLHQAGKGQQAETEQAYQQTAINYQVVEFIDDMASAYEKADLVICRAGALTVSEIAAIGRASIFVPLPHAVDDHQTFNARVLVDASCGYLLPQNQLANGELAPLLAQIKAKPEQLIEMAAACKQVAVLDSREKIGTLLEQLVQSK